MYINLGNSRIVKSYLDFISYSAQISFTRYT